MQGQEPDSMIFVGPFQPRKFCDSVLEKDHSRWDFTAASDHEAEPALQALKNTDKSIPIYL